MKTDERSSEILLAVVFWLLTHLSTQLCVHLCSSPNFVVSLTFFTPSPCSHPLPPLTQIFLSSHLPSPDLLSPHLWTFSLPHLSSSLALYVPPCVLSKPRPSVLPPAPLIKGHCCFFWLRLARLYDGMCMCVHVSVYVCKSDLTWHVAQSPY